MLLKEGVIIAHLTIMTMDNVTESIRGECTKWMLEVKPGTFVGTMNSTVRDLLWKRVCKRITEGGAFLIYQANTEQGFDIVTFGETKKLVTRQDGLILIKTPSSKTVSSSKQPDP